MTEKNYICLDCNNYSSSLCTKCTKPLNGIPSHWDDKEMETVEQGNALTAKHYQIADIQPIEIMQMYFSKEQFIGYLRGNILKYNLRYGNKDIPAKEAAKLAQYSIWLEDVENDKKIDPRK